jgi:UDP-N-acetylmuramoylalanine--D-glutamate ligase
MTNNWVNKHVLIIGAARQGLALARYLAGQGAVVTLNDKREESQMQSAIEATRALNINWVLGHHNPSLLEGIDLLCLSGGVSVDLPLAIEARRKNIPISNDSQIFMDIVPCPVTAITGSAGKTTTTTLLGKMAEAAATLPRRAWVGGNIGLPLIEYTADIQATDIVILELSSFQLELMHCSPHIAAILNITPNHLDRHGTLEAYTTAKTRILAHQTSQDIAILNRDDAGSWALKNQVKGHLVSFGINSPADHLDGSYYQNGFLYFKSGAQITPIMPEQSIKLRGEHNLQNVLAACAIAFALNISPEIMRHVVEHFSGVPHRLEFVRDWNGSQWYNDSIATAPERAMAALHSFHEPLVLLLGGRDKNLPWENLAALAHQRVKHIVVFGESAEKILNALGKVQTGETLQSITHCNGLQDAVLAAARVVRAGDVVLLSPGGTSFDEFKDFEERGESFRLWVNTLS